MNFMNIKELKELIGIVTSEQSIEEFEIEKSGVRLRIKRASALQPSSSAGPSVSAAPSSAAVSVSAPIAAPAADVEHLHYVKSPMVGTFYGSPNPTSDPYVSPGDSVQQGTVLCIIEAMKLMNEIESEVSGEIVSVLVKNGQPVEYGEKLFAIRSR
jgi:acetyl-CoA carboxylase biotin carboxyl carrier protein